MYKLRDILVSGKAQEDSLNVTTHDAETMCNYFIALFTGTTSEVNGLFINTHATAAMGSAEMIDVKDVEPYPDEGMRFYFQLSVESPTLGPRYWEVSSFYRAIDSGSLETATHKYMEEIDPEWNYETYEPTYQGISQALTRVFTTAMGGGEV